MFDFSGLAVMVKEEFGPAFVEALRRDIVFLAMMEDRKRDYVEKDIQWKVNYAGNDSVGSYSENDSLGTAGEQAYTTAQLSWSLNKALIRVSGLAQAVSQSPNSIIDAMAQEMESGLKDLKRNLNLQLLSDGVGNLNGPRAELAAGGTDITGILAAIDDGSVVTTYAGIDRTANAWWRSFVVDNGGVLRPLTEELMFQVTNEIETRGGKVTDILCSPNVWTKYGLLLKQERRQNDARDLFGGFKSLDFNGINVVKVPDYEEGRMDFINREDVEYMMLTDFAVEPRDPGNFDASQFFVKTYTELKYKDPWRAGSLRDIA